MKRWHELEKRIVALERDVQEQPKEIMKKILQQGMIQMTKSNHPYRQKNRSQCDGQS